MDDKKVKIYTSPTCAFCLMAKEWLKDKKIEFEEYDVAQDETKRNEMIEKTGQFGVPVIEVGEEIIIGFDREKLSQVLGLKD